MQGTRFVAYKRAPVRLRLSSLIAESGQGIAEHRLRKVGKTIRRPTLGLIAAELRKMERSIESEKAESK